MIRFRINIQILTLIILTVFLIIAGSSVRGAGSNDQRQVRIVITSDLHGWLSTGLVYPKRKRKGLLHIREGIEKRRSETPDLILLDAGDLLQGAPLVEFIHRQTSGRKAEVDPFFQLVRRLRYDAVAVGNHDLGINPLLEDDYLPAANFEWLAANLARGGKTVFKPYLILNRFGLKIAVLGFTTPGSEMWLGAEQLKGLQIEDIADSAERWLEKVRTDHRPDLVIGLFHSGLYALRDDENAKISGISPANGVLEALQRVDGFDLVIAGHDHRLSPYRSGRPVRHIRGTPVVEGGKWGEAFLDLQLIVNRLGRDWQIARVNCKVQRAVSDEQLDSEYLRNLPREYLVYLYAELPYTWTRTSRENARTCLNMINALAHETPDTDGSLLPRASAQGLSSFVGRQLRRLELYKIFRHDNRTVTVRLSSREINLLRYPEPESGRRRIPGNRILIDRLKEIDYRAGRSNWWLDREHFEPRYLVRIVDYHYHGGGGIIPQLFLSPERVLRRSEATVREKVFDYLHRRPKLPQECSFLKPVRDR